ncbi:hypothetical protein EV714DRAFT_216617, partial [Schizophyllum commune]
SPTCRLDIAHRLRTHQPRPPPRSPYFLVTREHASFRIAMALLHGTRAKDRRTTPNGRRTTPNERRTMHSERRTTYNHKRGTQPDDTLRVPSWHASHHPSLSVTSSSRSWHASDRSSWHASDHSSTSPVIYHNCRCSSTCPLSGPSASRGGNHSTCRGGDHTSCRGGDHTSYQLRRAEHHHRGSTFSFHEGWLLSLRDDRLTSSDAHRHSTPEDDLLSSFSGDPLSSSGSPLPPSGSPLPPSGSLPEYTYHISNRDRRWQAVLQDTIRRLIRSLGLRSARAPSKRALKDIARQATKLCKLDLVRKRSGLSISGASSAEGDSSATLFEGPTATGNAVERSVPSFLPSSPCHNTYAEPHDWPALEGSDRIGNAGGLREDAGSLREDAGGLVDNDHADSIDEDAGALYYVAGDALNFDDPSGFEVHAGGSVNDPSSLDNDDNASTISLLNGEPLAGSNISRPFSHSSRRACSGSSSTPYSNSPSRIEVWIAEVIGSHRGARENPPHYQGARGNPSRGASKHVAWDVGKYEGPSMSGRKKPSTSRRKKSSTPGRKKSSTFAAQGSVDAEESGAADVKGTERTIPKTVGARRFALAH